MPQKKPKVVNLPEAKLPIKPLTAGRLDREIERRIEKITQEFNDGLDFIKAHPKSVTFFGSSRFKKNNSYCLKAESLAGKLSILGYSIVTGGGPGIMEAANKGAYNEGGSSLGLTIKLPHEQATNPYITDHVDFGYFFSRKVCLSFSAEAYVYFPGGFGTLDELFEILTLVQTKKISKVPIILVGSEFWRPFDNFIKTTLYQKNKTIEKTDIELYQIVDDEDKIIKFIEKAPIRPWV
jgi:uncharacterized protein (TIGR00730 family)